MSNIPAAREAILKLADASLAEGSEGLYEELIRISVMLDRKPPIRKAKPSSRKMTPELAEEIRRYALSYPDLSQMAIAKAFGVNTGRVSEALNAQAD